MSLVGCGSTAPMSSESAPGQRRRTRRGAVEPHRPWLILLLLCTVSFAVELQDRWFFLSGYLNTDQQVDEFEQLAATAQAHGYTGVCWSGLEGIARWDADRLARFERAKAIAKAHDIEIIPLVFSVGYGGAALGYDKNLAVGHRSEGTLQAKRGEAVYLAEPVSFNNPGFEEFKGDSPVGWNFCDKPGEISFADREVKHTGEASLRFVNPVERGLGDHARAMQRFAVQPRRTYRMTLWCRGEDVAPDNAFRIQIYGGDQGPNLIAASVGGGTFDWKPVTVTFSTGEYDQVRLYAGTWGGRTGQFWLDEVSVEEVGLNNVLRRDGCPFELRSEDGQTVYEEGRDYAPVIDDKLLDFRPRPSLTVKLLPGGRIQDGEVLQASWYHAAQVANRQVSVCMSAPGLYEHYEQAAAKLAEVIPSRKFLLSMDEIRQGGTDLADQRRGLTMGEILGDCITREQAILRKYHPGATCYVWSDMLDPDHNAHGDYYQVEGSFDGSWKYVPKDLVIACWYGSKAETSLAFFDGLGFRTLGAAYYDADDLDGSKRWLEALAKTPRAVGIMYTTWRNKYDLLAGFGDLVAGFGKQ